MAAVLLDGELPAQPLGRDGAGDDGRQGQAASQTRLGYTLKFFPLTKCQQYRLGFDAVINVVSSVFKLLDEGLGTDLALDSVKRIVVDVDVSFEFVYR